MGRKEIFSREGDFFLCSEFEKGGIMNVDILWLEFLVLLDSSYLEGVVHSQVLEIRLPYPPLWKCGGGGKSEFSEGAVRYV